MRQPRLRRDLAELRADLSADLGLHQLARNERDRLADEILKPTIAHLGDDIGNRHALTFGHRGDLLHVDCTIQPTSSAPRWPTLGGASTYQASVTPLLPSHPLASQEVPAPDLETDQASVLGTRLDQPRRQKASLARRGPGDALSRTPQPLAVGGPRNRPGHHPAGDRRCLTSINDRPADVLWRAGCSGMGMSGSAGGGEETISRKADMAPRRRPRPPGGDGVQPFRQVFQRQVGTPVDPHPCGAGRFWP